MKFIANENFPSPSVNIIREAGYKVIHFAESSPGISDHQVIEQAKKSESIILTFDKDYGEIIFKHSVANSAPV
ncbi:MAG: DUF5615 family PIN-like protein [Flammeovirgaceae bacterium]|nr:DUF5615 family PIN-like protein [Flammeovirgaceae bacterium]